MSNDANMSQTRDSEIKQVLQLRDELNLSFAEIGSQLGFSERTARRRYETGVLRRAAWALEEETLEEFPESPPVDLPEIQEKLPQKKMVIERFKPMAFEGDAFIACDLHIPLHDPTLINVMIEAASRTGIKHLIIAGDYFHMEAFSSYLPHQPEASLEVERYEGNLVMKTLLKTFETIQIIWGNHDFRLAKALKFKKSFEETMKWMLPTLTKEEWDRVQISSLDYMEYHPGDDRLYRICHPRNFSSIPLTVGRKLAHKHRCSVITAHSHHFAMGVAPNGYDLVLEGGGFYNKQVTEYIQKTTTHHEWVPGFTFFQQATPYMISPIFGNTKIFEKEVISSNGNKERTSSEEGLVHV